MRNHSPCTWLGVFTCLCSRAGLFKLLCAMEWHYSGICTKDYQHSDWFAILCEDCYVSIQIFLLLKLFYKMPRSFLVKKHFSSTKKPNYSELEGPTGKHLQMLVFITLFLKCFASHVHYMLRLHVLSLVGVNTCGSLDHPRNGKVAPYNVCCSLVLS